LRERILRFFNTHPALDRWSVAAGIGGNALESNPFHPR
jgi:hypothetical protein